MRTFTLPLALFMLMLIGCGGGGSGSDSGETFTVPLGWGPRSRAVEGPSSALSARITLVNGSFSGTDLVYVVNRHADLASYTESYPSPEPTFPGGYAMNVDFFSGANATGSIVATASIDVAINKGGELKRIDGDPLGTIVADGKVASVLIPSGQNITVGETKDVIFTALDGSANILALTPGSAFLTITAGGDKLQIFSGVACTGVAVGNATLRATVDGIQSPTQTVEVVPIIAAE